MRQQASSFDHEPAKIKRRFTVTSKNLSGSTALDCQRISARVGFRVTGHCRHVMVNGWLA